MVVPHKGRRTGGGDGRRLLADSVDAKLGENLGDVVDRVISSLVLVSLECRTLPLFIM